MTGAARRRPSRPLDRMEHEQETYPLVSVPGRRCGGRGDRVVAAMTLAEAVLLALVLAALQAVLMRLMGWVR